MVYTIQDDCPGCDRCLPECYRQAIKPSNKLSDQFSEERAKYWIDPTLCDGCADIAVPRCVQVCDSNGSLGPLQAKKGRHKNASLPLAIPDIFLNGKTTPFASCSVIWEACTVLSQRHLLDWQSDANNRLNYRLTVNRGRGEMRFFLAENPEAAVPLLMDGESGKDAISSFDIRAACIHLIFSAYAMTLDRPWQAPFELTDQHIEKYLGLNRRKDLTKLEKLALIKDWVYQSCRLLVSLSWPKQGKVAAFAFKEQPVWHLLNTRYYFEKDNRGAQHLIGLSFTVRAGQWAQHFLNRQGHRHQTAVYQYGTLPYSLISTVMSRWQQHEGAVRLLLWLLFKLRLGGGHRLTVRTLLRVAYGEASLLDATTIRGVHQRLLKVFERDLEILYHLGIGPEFDPETYPPDIQPLWAKAAKEGKAMKESAERALQGSLADDDLPARHIPKDKWSRLLNARISGFKLLSEDWKAVRSSTVSAGNKRTGNKRAGNKRTENKHSSSQRACASTHVSGQLLSGEAIKSARKQQNLSQRALAERIGKSQSWVRDIEKERFSASASDQAQLRQALKIQ